MYGDSVQFKSTQMSCMLGFIKSVWKKTCYSDIPNPERHKTTSEEKHTLFEDVWGTSQGLFNGDLLSSSKGFLSPNLPFLAWKRIAKEPRGCNKNRSFLGWIKLFFPLSGRCFLLPLQRWQWKIPWLNSSNVHGYLPKPDGDFLLIQEKDPGGVGQPTFSNKMAEEWPVWKKIPDRQLFEPKVPFRGKKQFEHNIVVIFWM